MTYLAIGIHGRFRNSIGGVIALKRCYESVGTFYDVKLAGHRWEDCGREYAWGAWAMKVCECITSQVNRGRRGRRDR